MTTALGAAPVPRTLDASVVHRLLSTLDVASPAGQSEIVSPFTGTPMGSLPQASAADVDDAVSALRAGQESWAQLPVAERARVLLRFHDLVLARRDEGLDIVQAEVGKSRRDAAEEMLDLLLVSRHYARDAQRLLRPRRHRGVLPLATGVVELHVPRGVVGVLSPWNYPLALVSGDVLPALVAGNAVLVKPDHRTTLTALWQVGLMHEAGVPRDVVRLVPGDGAVVGPLVVDRVDYVMFTGSTPVGRQVAARCGERLVGCSLELGGKNAMIVRADADVRKAAEIAVRGSFTNAGQLCISMERIYIHDAVYDTFVVALCDRVAALEFATGIGWGGTIGSLISPEQRARVQAHVDDAVAAGARVLAGGRSRPDLGPAFFEPTVLDGVTEEMSLCRNETFGPVVALYRVHSDEEAIRRANDTVYGLNASVVTRDLAAGQAVARRLRAGTVNVNEAYGAAWGSTRAPMGGMGDSGLGRRHGDEGLLKYTEAQTIATQRVLGLGTPPGLSDERWLGMLTMSLAAMKKLGLK